MKNIAQILRNIRKHKGLTLPEVSRKTGIAFSTINTWERGICFPKPANRKIIAKYYGIDEELLIGDYEEPTMKKVPSVVADYETRPIMIHKSRWQMLEELQKDYDVMDVSSLIDRLVGEAWRLKRGKAEGMKRITNLRVDTM